MRPYAGVDYNLTLCPLQSRLQHICHGKPYDLLSSMPITEWTFTLCQSRLYPPVRDFGFGPRGSNLASIPMLAEGGSIGDK
jgi:hypothetical protein